VPSAAQLGLPDVCLELVGQRRGLVLVAGATGSGKSTTLAAMINHLNETASCRIITLEDPIEYVHQNKRSMIIQREIGGDTHSFNESLRRALRQDLDVIIGGRTP
jgi:twitching motility protein PilT